MTLCFYGALGCSARGPYRFGDFLQFRQFPAKPAVPVQNLGGRHVFPRRFYRCAWWRWKFYRRKLGCKFWELTDFIAPLVPLGLAAGRFGNFMNAELWGAPGNVPWAMKLSCEQFPPDRYIDFAGPLCFSARHPTQLYEMLLEGILLFLALWLISAKPRPLMTVSGYFLLLYGLARSSVEFIRLPDAHIGYLMNTEWLTRGIVLSLPMIIVGVILLILAKRGSNSAAIS